MAEVALAGQDHRDARLIGRLFGYFVIGSGFLLGGFISGEVSQYFTTGVDESAVSNFTAIWLSAGAIAAVPASTPRMPASSQMHCQTR